MNNFFYRCCKKKECIHMIEVGFNLHFMFCSSSWLLLTTISAFVLTFILHSSTDKPPTEESHNLMSGQLADYICLGDYLLCLIMWIPKFQSPTCVETLRFYKMMQAKLCARQVSHSSLAVCCVGVSAFRFPIVSILGLIAITTTHCTVHHHAHTWALVWHGLYYKASQHGHVQCIRITWMGRT